MAPRSRGAERIFTAFASSSLQGHVCRSCRQNLFPRHYASAATAEAATDDLPSLQKTADAPVTPSAAQPKFTIKAGIVVSRPPLVTPDPHPFETAYHFYQRRLNERLVLPFTQYFYFKRGTPAFDQWRRKRSERGGAAARDVGKYDAHGEEGWNDEVLVGNESGNPRLLVEQLVEEEGRASEFVGTSGELSTAGLKRTTEADKNNDRRSLERSLSRTLYLLVMTKRGDLENWTFPSGLPEGREGLREAAQRILGESCGVNMNTWFVGNHPVGHYVGPTRRTKALPPSHEGTESKETQTAEATDAEEGSGEKTFFMKARIMAGQADVKTAGSTYADFHWLAKEEVKERVHPSYWSRIKNMLVEQ